MPNNMPREDSNEEWKQERDSLSLYSTLALLFPNNLEAYLHTIRGVNFSQALISLWGFFIFFLLFIVFRTKHHGLKYKFFSLSSSPVPTIFFELFDYFLVSLYVAF